MFCQRWILLLAIVFFEAGFSLGRAESDSDWRGVRIFPEKGKLRIEVNGSFFADYIYEEVSRPFLYPVIGPAGLPVTRNWPMSFQPGEAKDHPHHRSFWYAHGDVNGHDFWSESSRAGRIEHVYFQEIVSGAEWGRIVAWNRLVAKNGAVVGTDKREITIYNRPDSERQIDFDITFLASHGDLVLGDTKEGSMAIRLAPTMRLKGEVAQGRIVNSEGLRDGETWGQRAKWVDYSGPVQGKTVGVAIFDHPDNPRHPTWWHVRDYGLFAANPFGIHNFERKEKGLGDYRVPASKSAQWKYRFFMHLGNAKEADVESKYAEYTQTK